MSKQLSGVWLALIVPFAVAGATGGPDGPLGHTGFHVAYICATLLEVALIRAFPGSSNKFTAFQAPIVRRDMAVFAA